jgi:hypothetical protein
VISRTRRNMVSKFLCDGSNRDDPISQAPKIRIPVLVFSTDGALIPGQAKKFYDRVQSEKQLVWGTGYHFNFYDVFP